MHEFLAAAIDEAEQGRVEGGIPIGAVLVHGGRIIGRGHNRRVQQGSAVLHGEMDARAGRPATGFDLPGQRDALRCATVRHACSGAILLYGIRQSSSVRTAPFWEKKRRCTRGVQVDVVQD